MTGQNTAELCAKYEQESGRHGMQPIGFRQGLFELAVGVLKRTRNVDSPAAIRDAIASTNYHSIVGHIAWTGLPTKIVTRTPWVGGQRFPGRQFKKWAAHGREFKYDLVIVSNESQPQIGRQAKPKALSL